VKSALSSEFEMKDLGSITRTTVLGLKVIYDQQTRFLNFSTKIYISSLLTKYKLESCNPIFTPLEPRQKLSKDQCPQIEEDTNKMKNIPYMTIVGCIQYLLVST
jgi:hypothetical protein